MLPVQIIGWHLLEIEEDNERFRFFNNERRLLRDRSDPFRLQDRHFINLFRLRKDMVYYLCLRLTPYITGQDNPMAIRSDLKIFMALSFFATGTYQRPVGQNFLCPMAQSTVSTCVAEISKLLCRHLAQEWITFPTVAADIERKKRRFLEATEFPNTIGAVDCTHVAMISPSEEEHNYLNRKGFHSKNVQIICDYDLRIMNINARYAGATHDAYIWRNSIIKAEMERRYLEGDHNTWCIGDSGYPQQPWLMTPITDTLPNTPERRYTRCLVGARASIERCIGVLKGRFRCILGERMLHYDPLAVSRIVTACAILHNICIDGRLPIDNCFHPEVEPYLQPVNAMRNENANLTGILARKRVIQTFFYE